MTSIATTAAPQSRVLNRTLWGLQIFLGIFMIAASAAPKLWGEATAVQIFEDMGTGTWFRLFVGAVELAGGIGLLIARLAGPAAVGLALLMVGAAITQAFVLHGGAMVLTPVVLIGVFTFIARGRRASIRRFIGR